MRTNKLGAIVAVIGIASVLIGLALSTPAKAASTQVPSTGVSLWRGTSKLSDANNRVVDPANNTLTVLSPENCSGIRDRIIARDALTRTTGTATYRCQIDLRASVTFRPNTCATPRAPATRQVACPNNPERMFTQTQTWTVAPYPTCEIAGAWLPATPSVTDCPPTQLPAPTGVEATAVSTSEIRVRWNVVPDAVAYSLRRCIGATCDPLSRTPLLCTQTLEARHVTLNPGVTVRYQVEAARASDCSGELSAPSSPLVSATTLTSTPPDPQPEPVGTASVSWTPPTQNTNGTSLTNLAGYRIHYGLNAEELVQTVQLANPGSSSYTISSLTPGTYYFAVRAYTSGGTESVNSNIVSKVVP